MAGDGVGEAKSWLVDYFKQAEGDFLCLYAGGRQQSVFTPFAAAGEQFVIRRCIPMKSKTFWRLDIALRRNDTEWYEHLPPEIDSQLVHKLYYGHFMCYVFHQDYIVKKGVDVHAFKRTDAGTATAARRAIPCRA